MSHQDDYKDSLVKQLQEKHLSLTSFIDTLPINSKMKEIALTNLDQGYLWTREAISSMKDKEEVPHPLCGTIDGGL
jgi:hypothetical protein